MMTLALSIFNFVATVIVVTLMTWWLLKHGV
jgi:hypothetical protein